MMRRSVSVGIVIFLLASCGSDSDDDARPPAQPGPWQRTEARTDCAEFDVLRRPFFGETHVHSKRSFDAVSGGIELDPRDAYRFAMGESVELPPLSEPREVRLRRPLDFTAVTDHSEFFGEVDLCLTPGMPGYDSADCRLFRAAIPQTSQSSSPGVVLFGVQLTQEPAPRFDFCGPGASICQNAASPIWQDMLDAADEFYDRSAACSFTTFPAYEWTGNPDVQNNHRNVIFRNEFVIPLPISYLDQTRPQNLWAGLREQCLDAGTGCDVLAIPHNSNLSNGIMFLPETVEGGPLGPAAAAERAAMEPLVEVMQHKGDSECHPDLSPTDELCGFEKWTADQIGIPPEMIGTVIQEPTSFVRNALMIGLEQEEAIGVNPFRMGMLAATDSHNATPGLTNENDFIDAGHLGLRDATPQNQMVPLAIGVVGGVEANGGGLAVIWAEENSRDALFAAMRRREVYGTSGTRPVVRFFGGEIPLDACETGTVVESGYREGVPMGGEIGLVADPPRFAVMASRDPGAAGFAGTPLQRVQIVKGWVDADGTAREKVFEIAGDSSGAATVDTDTCETSGPGFDSLCEVWADPEFDSQRRAFYYARVVENPICRWSTVLCQRQGVDCAGGAIPEGLEECCNPARPKTIQERAWTSPIWYRPEGVARLDGEIAFARGGGDLLRLEIGLGADRDRIDPTGEALSIALVDDDEIYSVTIPAGSLAEDGERYVYEDPDGSLNDLARAVLTFDSRGGSRLVVETIATDLSNADRSDHMVHATVRSGDYMATHDRLWDFADDRLQTGPR
jgi:hypothetical protein